MATSTSYNYRKNFLLLGVFICLALITLALALYVAYGFVKNAVENEFFSKKADVLDRNLADYSDLFSNRIPEVSFYQGYLDSAGARSYSDTILTKYPFVKRIVFFDLQVGQSTKGDVASNDLGMSAKAVYQFGLHIPTDSTVLYKESRGMALPVSIADDFNHIAAKFASFIARADTTRSINNDEINEVFYTIVPERISYLNIPRREEIIAYKNMIYGGFMEDQSIYEQDLFSYQIDPKSLSLYNNHLELYENIEIRPLFYETLDTNPDLLTTESALPGALAAYKIYYTAHRDHLLVEVRHRFWPMAMGIGTLFFILGALGVLIYRNLNFNHMLFKLQYDFINNLSHEFKTPVSVIKIAGNNIMSANELSEKARKHYGRILDEEADKLNNLLNTLLSFTQIENKSIKLREEEIDLEEFCHIIVSSYQIKYPNFSINFSLEDIRYFITDRVLLGAVFQNLIDNAYKYSQPDKKKLDIFIYRNKRQIFFKFVDTGIGIPAHEQENIFKKFYRIQSQYNQQGSVGIGLAFCNELIRFMDGSIAVSSELGKGSVFTVVLPYHGD